MNYSYILIQKLGLIKYLTLPAELEFEIEKVVSPVIKVAEGKTWGFPVVLALKMSMSTDSF
jgi:hypothetical protein